MSMISITDLTDLGEGLGSTQLSWKCSELMRSMLGLQPGAILFRSKEEVTASDSKASTPTGEAASARLLQDRAQRERDLVNETRLRLLERV